MGIVRTVLISYYTSICFEACRYSETLLFMILLHLETLSHKIITHWWDDLPYGQFIALLLSLKHLCSYNFEKGAAQASSFNAQYL